MKRFSTPAVETAVRSDPAQTKKIHFLLIVLGIFLLLQDLLAENFKSVGLLFTIIKYVDETVPLFLFLLLVFSRIAQGRFIRRTALDIPLLLFLLIALASSVVSLVDPFIVVSQFLIYIKAFMVLYLLHNLPITRGDFQNYVRVFFWVGVGFFLFGIVDLFFPEQLRTFTGTGTYIDYRSLIPSVKSLFVHPGIFGWFMSSLALFCFAFAIVETKYVYFYTGILFSFGCFLSMRARSIFGLIVALFCGLLFVVKKRRPVILVVLLPIVLVSIFTLGPALTELFETKITEYVKVEDPYKLSRNALYLKSIDVARDNFPFGAGMGRYGSHLSALYYSPLYEKYGLSRVWGLSREKPDFITDTFWPMILGESGFIGLGLYMLIIFAVLLTQVRRVKRSIDPLSKAFHLGVLMLFIKGLLESIADPFLAAPPPALFILGAVGLSGALARAEEQDHLGYVEPMNPLL